MRVTVDYITLNQPISDLKIYAAQLSTLIENTRKIQSALEHQKGLGEFNTGALQRVINSTEAGQKNIIQLKDVAETSMKEYRICEENLAKTRVANTAAKFLAMAQGVSGIGAENEPVSIKWSDIFKLVGAFGFTGKLTSITFGSAADTDKIGDNWFKLLELSAKTGAKIADHKLIDMFGTKTVDAIGFRENLAIEFDKYVLHSKYNSNNLSIAAKSCNTAAAVAKWGGVAWKTVTNFMDNFEEFNSDFSNPRMYAETIGETVIEIGGTALITAGVATLAGATAPVWAVGAVGAGIAIGLDWASEQIFGKKMSEAISDWTLDRIEDLGDFVQDVGKNVGEFVQDVGENVGNFVQGVGEGIGNAVNAAADFVSTQWNGFMKVFGW